jgi:hypothetical protein
MYLLDSDVLMEAHKRELHPDICPAFWDWLVEANESGVVASIDAVYTEIAQQEDWLADWARAHRGLFLPSDDATETAMGRVSAWAANHGVYNQAAKNQFLGAADVRLVASGLAWNQVVVTRESFETPEAKPGKIKIPTACDALGVTCTSPARMLRQEGVRFILDR